MPALIIIFVVVALVVSAAKNKQQQEAARRSRTQQVKEAEANAARAKSAQPPRQRGSLEPTVHTSVGTTQNLNAQTARTTRQGANAADGASGHGSMAYASTEGTGRGSLPPTKVQGELSHKVAPSNQHIVKPSSSGHTHSENSMTGIEPDCVPTEQDIVEFIHDDAYGIEAQESSRSYGLLFDGKSVMQGIIMSEVLSKPRALRARR